MIFHSRELWPWWGKDEVRNEKGITSLFFQHHTESSYLRRIAQWLSGSRWWRYTWKKKKISRSKEKLLASHTWSQLPSTPTSPQDSPSNRHLCLWLQIIHFHMMSVLFFSHISRQVYPRDWNIFVPFNPTTYEGPVRCCNTKNHQAADKHIGRALQYQRG